MPFRVDERVLKPRVAGFIAVGGSLTSQWKTLALPILHTSRSRCTWRSSTRCSSRAQERRSRSCSGPRRSRGRRSSAATWRRRSAARSRTPSTAARTGCARCCHLDVVTLRGSDVECATCGARGVLEGGGVRWTDLDTSVISMTEKRKHFAEIRETAARHATQREAIDTAARAYGDFDRFARPPG